MEDLVYKLEKEALKSEQTQIKDESTTIMKEENSDFEDSRESEFGDDIEMADEENLARDVSLPSN